MLDIFKYKDFRAYLKDHYEMSKENDANFTYKKFSEIAGLNSPNYLKLVMDGDRNLTVTKIHQFAKALKLRPDERIFFEALVLMNQSKDEDESDYYRKRLVDLRKQKPSAVFTRKPDEAIQDWFYTGVMVLAHGRSLEEAKQKAKNEMQLEMSAVEKCLKELIHLELLVTDENGKLQISAQQVMFHDPRSLSQLQQNFLWSQLEQSRMAFKKNYASKKGKFLSQTLTIPEGALDDLHQRFIALVEELTQEMDQKIRFGEEKVAQINVQLFHPRNWI